MLGYRCLIDPTDSKMSWISGFVAGAGAFFGIYIGNSDSPDYYSFFFT